MNTFRDIAEDEIGRSLRQGIYITSRDANIRAADRILDGFRDLEEAGEFARDEMTLCDVYGYWISPSAIEWAIWVKLSPKVIKFQVGDNVDYNGAKGSVQYWGRPGKRGMVKCSMRQAIKSGNPCVYLWLHDTEEHWEWVKALTLLHW